MGKQEFIDRLRVSLNGQMASAQVSEHLRYYEDYINTEIRKGRGESEVLNTLGDPRLIARSILDAGGYGEDSRTGTQGNAYNGYYEGNSYQSYADRGTGYAGGGNGAYGKAAYGQSTADTSKTWSRPTGRYSIPRWLWTILSIVLVFVVISAFFSLVSFLLPLVFPVLIVVFVVKLFRDWLK